MNFKRMMWLLVIAFAVLATPVAQSLAPKTPTVGLMFDGAHPPPPWPEAKRA
ncbi:MAG: hypothetical protein WBP79_11365 [Candidatus Acidiferrales bacterium]